MKRFSLLTLLLLTFNFSFPQLADIKIIIPKEIGYSYYDFVQFFPDEKHFVVCANSLSVFNTETAEVVDEYDLPYGAKNLSISADGNSILCTVNSELFVFSFKNQKLQLSFKTNTAELIRGLPKSEYYGALPIGGCFFTNKPNEIYVSVGSFTLLYDLDKKTASGSYAFPQTDYIIHSVYSPKTNEALLAKSSGTMAYVVKQSLNNLSSTGDLLSDAGTIVKARVRDSLLFCFTNNKYFILDLVNSKVVHEVRMPKFDYSFYDKKTYTEVNKRPSITKPDTINFEKDEYVYDIDFLSSSGQAIYSTSKGLKFIDLKTKKLSKKIAGSFTNVKLSPSGRRMICNGYSPYKALRVYEPTSMNLVSERPAMGSAITSADISPNKRWLYTNGGSSGFFWDLTNFSKYAEIRDISGSDSAFIYGVFFLNDSEVVVNSGKSFQHLNLHIYNLQKKKYGRAIKKNVYAVAAGFLNGEFYYADYSSLHILNLKTLAEEKYDGLYSMAAGGMYQVVNFTKDHVFVPEAGKYKIVNRKTKKEEYESGTWTVNSKVLISPDGKSVYSPAQITKKKSFNGVEVDMPVNAIVKIDIAKKEVEKDFAQTWYPYDMKFKNGGKSLGIWYVKFEVGSTAKEQETMYTEYDTETGAEVLSRSLAKTPELIAYHYTSENGKYFALNNPMGKFFKIYDTKGNELMDLSDLNISIPKCFFVEDLDRLIITSTVNSLATFVDLKNKKVIGQLANATSDNFFLITSDLCYLGSKDFVKNMRFKHESEIYSFEQFDAYLNLPHRVLRDFGCSDSALIQAYETAYLKRMRVLGLKPGSKINFSSLPTIQDVKMREGKNNFAEFTLSANKGQNKLSKLDVFNNGTLIFSETIPAEQSARYEKSMAFETSSGLNRFEFVVKDESGLESPHTTRLFNNTSNIKPNLYLVVIASEKFKDKRFDLAYAMKDASDIAKSMTNSKAFNKVEIKKVFNQSFSKDSVQRLSTFFSKATINDVVMIFFAGHGYLDTDLSYYFPTYFTDFSDPKINSVPYKEFEKLFKDMKPTRKLMFIDACFSGEVDEEDIEFTPVENDKKETKKDSSRSINVVAFTESTALEMSKAVFSDLRQNSGATIISSAGGTEAAFEGEKWNNGLFTHCLLDGMTNLKADENRDKKITLGELQKFVSEEVNRLSNGKQTPTYRVENTVLDYELW